MVKRIFEALRTPGWLLVIAALTLAVFPLYDATIGMNGLHIPDAPDLPPWPYVLAAITAISMLLARPFHYWKKGYQYKVWKLIIVPKADAERRRQVDPKRYIRFAIGSEIVASERQWFWRRFRLTLAFGLLVGGAALFGLKLFALSGLDVNYASLLDFRPSTSSVVWSADGVKMCVFTKERREYVRLDQVPPVARQAFIAAEDQHFMEHRGLDIVAMIRAFWRNWRGGDIQGASTITQQIVKQLLLKDSTRSYWRKIREAFIAADLEKKLTKDQILEIYLNHIFLSRAYGIQAAAMSYFGMDVSQLTLAEAVILAGMPPAPFRNSTSHVSEEWKRRVRYVLRRMVEMGFISEETADEAAKRSIVTIEHQNPLNRTAAPYACEFIRREIEPVYGTDLLFRGGLTIISTIDMRFQNAATAAVRRGLDDLGRRIGFHGPEGHDDAWNGSCSTGYGLVADGIIQMATVSRIDGPRLMVCADGMEFPFHPEDVARIRAWENRNVFGPDDIALGSNGVALGRVTYGREVVDMDGETLGTIGAKDVLTRHDGQIVGRVFRKMPRLMVGDRVSIRVETFGASKKSGLAAGRYALSARRIGGADNPDALQAGFVAVDPTTGELKALVGGYDFSENQFNVAVQRGRQTGSSFKPYVYATALARGMTVTDTVVDGPACYATASGAWCPENYLGRFTRRQYLGRVDLQTALAKSLNSVSVKLAAKVGIGEVIRTVRRFGIQAPITRILAAAVGTPEFTLWEHVYGYAVFAANGRAMPVQCWQNSPRGTVCRETRGVFIRKILQGPRIIHETGPIPVEQAIPSAVAYETLHLMRGVVSDGTGRRVQELRRPAAGKTGTTNDFKDAWFMGCTADICAGTWVGRQSPGTVAEEATGGAVALPIWMAAMKAGHPDTPPREFPVPDDVILTLRKGGDSKKPTLVPYRRGMAPIR